MATDTPNFNWPIPEDTDLVKDGAEAIRDLGNAIDTTVNTTGLVHINSTALTSSATTIDNVFTSDYKNYKIFIDSTTGAIDIIRMRLVLSGTPATGANDYKGQEVQFDSTGTNPLRTSDSFFRFSRSATAGASEATIFGPQLAQNTRFINYSSSEKAGPVIVFELFTGWHILSTQYTGIQFIPAAGSLSGTARIYGIKG